MEQGDEKFFEVGGKRWYRQPVTATLKLAKANEIPDQVIQATAAKKNEDPAYFFMDGVNPDLVYVSFILDTEGYNDNWDFMPRKQLVQSYATSRFKPFDANHAVQERKTSMNDITRGETPVTFRNTIYGVMTHAALADADGKLLTPKQIKALDLTDELDRKDEDKVHVVAWAALYNFLFPKTVTELVTAVEEGAMRVSMERWVSECDFMYWNADDWKTCSRADAEKNGIHEMWEKKLGHAGKPVYRRSLAYVYGGVASTTNPANKLSRFLDQSPSIPAKAVASLRGDPVLEKMLEEHDAIHRQFCVASETEKPMLIARHDRIHRAVAAYVGGEA